MYNAQRRRVNTIRGIFRLKVTNRFRTTVRRYSRMSVRASFNGYGKLITVTLPQSHHCYVSGVLEVDDDRAKFNQQGADPVVSS